MPGPQRGDAAGPCPIGRAVDVLGERWTLLILRNATGGMTRFEDFRADLGIADNVLSDRLSRLVGHGLLSRREYRPAGGGRRRHEYRLTTAGEDLLPLLHALLAWGAEHTEPAEPTGRMRVVHRVCGGTVDPGRECPDCGVPPGRDELAWVRPWRSATPYPLAGAV